jgi:hypothetical protein
MTASDMSDNCKQYIRWMIQGVSRMSFQSVSQLDDREIFRALAIPAREEMEDLFDTEPEPPPGFADDIPGVAAVLKSPWQRAAVSAAAMGGQVLSRMPQMIYAYHVVKSGKLNFSKDSAAPTQAAKAWATDYVNRCVDMKGIPLNTLEDLTRSLPAASASPPALSDADFNAAAATLGVDVPAIRAVAQVESAGSGFGADGRPIIRYELHRFQSKTGGHFHRTHPYLSQPSLAAGNPYHNGTQSREYSMLFNAMLLKYRGGRAIEQAIASASWGKFQVMGENWASLGWSSALDFATDMYASEANHLLAFVRFIQHNGLTNALRMHQWAAFAAGYNGPSYAVNNYDTNMERAFNRFNRAHPAAAHP